MSFQPSEHPDSENPYGSQEPVPYIPDSDAKPQPPPAQPAAPSPASSPVPHPPPVERETGKTKSNPAFTIIAVIGVVVVLLAGSGGIFYTLNRAAQDRASTTATATAVQSNSEATTQANMQQAQATRVALLQATATAYASTNPYPTYPVPKLNDPLTGNGDADWYVGDIGKQNEPATGSCNFTADAYHAMEKYKRTPDGGTYFASCTANATNFSNFVYQVQMTILKGDCGGLLFRNEGSDKIDHFYYFTVCQDGSYELSRYREEKQPDYSLSLTAGNSSAIKQGLKQSNQIAVAVHNDTFDLYVNKQHIGSARNSEFSKGHIGVIAVPQKTDTEVAYNNAQVWVPL